MAVRTPTVWAPPSGTGYVTPSDDSTVVTQSGLVIITQSGVELIINPDTYQAKYPTAWAAEIKNDTSWTPPSGEGYVTASTTDSIATQASSDITTQSGLTLIIEDESYQPKYATSWTESSKNDTHWLPPSGSGYVVNAGAYDLTTNLSDFIVTNSGDNIVTTPTYDINKYPTLWELSGE